MALESGTVDAILGDIPPNDVVALENNPKFNVYNGGGSVMVTWSFSSASNVSGTYSTTLRKAIASAIDLEPALKLVFNGTVTPLYSIIPTYFPSYTPVFKTLYPHDVTMAKTYLAQAGFPNGVTIDLTEQSQYPLRIALYEALKQQLADAGITLNIHPMETSAYMDLLYKGGGLLLGNYWGPVYADPDEPLGAIWSTSGSWMGTFYNSSLVDQLYMEQRSTSNQSRRQEIFVKLQQIAAEDLPYIPLYQYSEKLVAKKELKGITDLYVRYPAWWHRVYLEGQTTGQIAPFTPQIVLDVKATDASKLNLNFQYSQK
jgi:peptide/nickel transport system substrate-binding protein